MSDEHFVNILKDITAIVETHLADGARPHDILVALEHTKFSIMMTAYKKAEAFNQLYNVQTSINDIERK